MKTHPVELLGDKVNQVRNLVSFAYCLIEGEATVFATTFLVFSVAMQLVKSVTFFNFYY